jgi:three-Cys-motif partner protein
VPKKEYTWEVGQPPPTLHVHSLAKHEVLRAYLIRYLDVLAANPKIDHFRLTLVDGFSGGGLYLHEHTKKEISGSPLIFLEATRQAAAEINLKKTKKFNLDAHYFFIEKNKQTLDYLNKLLIDRDYGPLLDNDRIKLLEGEFTERAAAIINFIKQKGRKRRTIFLLDQYGYLDVPFPLLRQIFSNLPNAEVILTFAVDALGSFLSDSAESQLVLSRLGIAGQLDLKRIAEAKGASDKRFFIQASFGPIFQKKSGARFYTPFFITSRESNRDYWLVHLSMHDRARDEMTKLHWKLENHFRHNGGAGLNMLGYDPDKDEAITGQPDFPDFNFDANARALSIQSLKLDLPGFMIQHPDGVQFQQLLEETCNTTPASSDHYREVLGELLNEKEITVTSKDGGQRRKGETINKSDIIKVSRQPSLFFFRKK